MLLARLASNVRMENEGPKTVWTQNSLAFYVSVPSVPIKDIAKYYCSGQKMEKLLVATLTIVNLSILQEKNSEFTCSRIKFPNIGQNFTHVSKKNC